MSIYKTETLQKALLKKGFEKGITHHEMYWLCVEGKRTEIKTRISHGRKEYGDNLLGLMAREIKLRRSQFDDFIECPLSADEYLELLRQQGII